MKKINLIAMLALVSGFLFTACDDDPEPNNLVTIEGIPATAEIENLGTLEPVNATITAEDGLASVTVTKDGDTYLEPEFEANATSLSLEFSYTAEEADADQNIVFEFTAIDADGDSETVTHVLSVGEAPAQFPNEVLSGLIEEDLTLTSDRIWELAGRVIVTAGNTLTIEPGTIIKGRPGDAAAASVLIIARGGDIQANGTAEAPIVFTSTADEIGVGEFESSLDLTTQRGLWGGVLILGNAPISAEASEAQIEGIPVTVTEGLYGGDAADDNSGVFEYVSIRFTGAELGPGNELQGLTLGGVGSGTTINHVESINSSDDGVEIFGGTVNISNFIVWAQDDDGYDTDQGWSGTIDNFVYIGADEANGYAWDGDHGMELDGSEGDDGSTNLVGKFINGSLRGLSSSDYADLRDGAKYDIQNTYFFDFAEGSDIEIDADDNDDDPRGSDNYANDITKFIGLEFNTTNAIGDIFVDQLDAAAAAAANDRTETEFAAQITANNAKFISNNAVVSEPTVGADVSVLAWSYAAAQGQLDSF
ncbi:hypothetical protein ABWH96_04195 [Marivirga tractuosa]|uniref:hypothetical protein n=1 Tax=Marivirga tractuosa TaxID=1006 RepID=UPI0035D1379E